MTNKMSFLETKVLICALDRDEPAMKELIESMLPHERWALRDACERVQQMIEHVMEESLEALSLRSPAQLAADH